MPYRLVYCRDLTFWTFFYVVSVKTRHIFFVGWNLTHNFAVWKI